MIDKVKIREIIVGVSEQDDILGDISWFRKKWGNIQVKFPNNIVSLDNAGESATMYDVFRMGGFIECSEPVQFPKKPDLELFPGFNHEDRMKQLPVKIMIGDGITYMLIVSQVLPRNANGEYLVKSIRVQEEVLDFLEELPVSVELR